MNHKLNNLDQLLYGAGGEFAMAAWRYFGEGSITKQQLDNADQRYHTICRLVASKWDQS